MDKLKKKKRFVITFEEDTHRKIREVAYQLDLSMSGVIRRYVNYGLRYLDDNKYLDEVIDEKSHLV